jgi:hypothetical protein
MGFEEAGVAELIGLSVAPVFLLAGLGAILNVMTHRLARVIDRSRALEAALEAGESEEAAARHLRELKALSTRMTLVNAAITAGVSASLCVCSVVALLFLGGFLQLPLGGAVAGLFVLAMLLVMAGLALLLVEISVAMRSVRIRTEFLMDR